LNGAGRYHHAVGQKRTAGQTASDVFKSMDVVRQVLEIRRVPLHLQMSGSLGSPAENQVDFHTRSHAKFFEQPEAVN
jgi:hypothetical protein